jgi:hypothetical protein
MLQFDICYHYPFLITCTFLPDCKVLKFSDLVRGLSKFAKSESPGHVTAVASRSNRMVSSLICSPIIYLIDFLLLGGGFL